MKDTCGGRTKQNNPPVSHDHRLTNNIVCHLGTFSNIGTYSAISNNNYILNFVFFFLNIFNLQAIGTLM